MLARYLANGLYRGCKVVSAQCLAQSKSWRAFVSSSSVSHELCSTGSEIWTAVYWVVGQLEENGCGIPGNHPVLSDL